MSFLLDVNVLLALFDPLHESNASVRRWFSACASNVASCPLTELGFVRVCTHPRYPNPLDTPEHALKLIRALHQDPRHAFWPDALSLVDAAFAEFPFNSHRETTDRYLLRLAVHQHGQLLTLDQSMRPANDVERAALCVLTT